jgi:hypothetical protein
MTTILEPFPRVELTRDELDQARKDALKLTDKYGFANLGKMLAMLAVENARLTKECNLHRAARGLEPMPTFKV